MIDINCARKAGTQNETWVVTIVGCIVMINFLEATPVQSTPVRINTTTCPKW